MKNVVRRPTSTPLKIAGLTVDIAGDVTVGVSSPADLTGDVTVGVLELSPSVWRPRPTLRCGVQGEMWG